MVQFSHPYMTTGNTITLTRQTFVIKVMPLLFNMLSRLVIAFLPRSKCFLISWWQSPSGVILKPKKIKSVTVSIVSRSICHEVMWPDAKIFIFGGYPLDFFTSIFLTCIQNKYVVLQLGREHLCPRESSTNMENVWTPNVFCRASLSILLSRLFHVRKI